MNSFEKLEWLYSKFYVFLEVSPTSDASIQIFNIDKYGQPITNTGRRYPGKTLQAAMEIAYGVESKNLSSFGSN